MKKLIIVLIFLLTIGSIFAEWRRLPNGEYGYYTRGNKLGFYFNNNGSFTFDLHNITDILVSSADDADDRNLVTEGWIDENVTGGSGGSGTLNEVDERTATLPTNNFTDMTKFSWGLGFDLTQDADTVDIDIDLTEGYYTYIRFGGSSAYVKLGIPILLSSIDFILPSTEGTIGQFLCTDGDGNTSWETPSGTGWADKIEEGGTSIEVQEAFRS